MDREVVTRTARTVVTSWLPGDAEALWAVHSDAQTMRFVRHGRLETPQETAALLEQYLNEHAHRGWTKWRVSDHHGHLIGRAGFGAHGSGRELGYTLRRDQWGQGLATELATALVGWHHDHAPDILLQAYAAVENTASQRVLIKVGFQFVGTEDHHGTPYHTFRLPATAAQPLRR